MKSIDLKKVVCVSLKSHNESQLNAIAFTYDLSLVDLLDLKDKGVKKIWIHSGGGIVIAGLDTTNNDDIYFSPEYLPMTSKTRKQILSILPVKTPKISNKKTGSIKEQTKSSNFDNLEFSDKLDVDTILDKISSSGMNSLTEREIDYLKSLK